jgi:mRNA-degrading endonuclease toxin of MazEF toxin-antitoxin module
MARQMEPRAGDIYWLEDCPPIHGQTAKTRPVVVLTSTQAAMALGGILAVACTSSAYPTDTLAIELPSHPHGITRSGLKKRTWAVPKWYVLLQRQHLGTYIGYVSGPLLDQLVQAVFAEYRHRNPE